MLSIQHNPQKPASQATVHLLPCKIKTAGPANATKTFWNPVRSTETKGDGEENTKLVHFRGRKLIGATVKIPEGYVGTVIDPSAAATITALNELDVDADVDEPVKICSALATFEGIVLWAHEEAPDRTAEPVWKGMEEWMAFARKIHDVPENEGRE